MAYTTLAAIEIAIGAADLAALSTVEGVAQADVVGNAIAEAEALIDSYAHKRYTTPFATTPPTIAALASRMAVRIMRRDRRMVLASDVEDEKRDREWLDRLSKGLVTVGVQPSPAGTELAIDKSGERDPSLKNVSRDRLKGFW